DPWAMVAVAQRFAGTANAAFAAMAHSRRLEDIRHRHLVATAALATGGPCQHLADWPDRPHPLAASQQHLVFCAYSADRPRWLCHHGDRHRPRSVDPAR